ncbi:MAG: trypsin-like peptidase domain-containing protein [Patescibacteria group bacterium]|nr:trypsin-like peptidase domain-containing protein [Patescibacteria group bacterium]
MKKIIFKNWSNSIIIVALIASIIGSLAGMVSGFYAANLLNSYNEPVLESTLWQKVLKQNLKEKSGEKYLATSNEETKSIEAVEKANPAVVSIVVSKYVSRYYGMQRVPFDDFFDDFFNFGFPFDDYYRLQPEEDDNKEPKQKQEVGGGTGFIISGKEGLVLTNKHVINEEDAEYTVITNDGEKYEAKVLASDPFNDIAILKVEVKDLPEVKLGDSDKIKIGQTAIAIGNALGEYRNTVTKGVISGISRRIVAGDAMGNSEVLEDVIQTDAAINFGNSGGPLINLQGEVIGVNTAINREGQLIGFAIPINQVKKAIGDVKEHGRVIRPFLGVRYLLIDEEIAKENKLPYNYGALIVRGEAMTDLAVIPGSPANKAGLVENDIILEINNQKITEEKPLVKEIQKYKPGEELKLKIYHQGEEETIKVILEEYQD